MDLRPLNKREFKVDSLDPQQCRARVRDAEDVETTRSPATDCHAHHSPSPLVPGGCFRRELGGGDLQASESCMLMVAVEIWATCPRTGQVGHHRHSHMNRLARFPPALAHVWLGIPAGAKVCFPTRVQIPSGTSEMPGRDPCPPSPR